MRLFNMPVFEEWVEQTATRYSSAALYNPLGEAEKLVVQIRASRVTGTSPTLTVYIEHSNDGKDWQSAVTLMNNVAISSIVNVTIADTGTTKFGALLRFVVGVGGTAPAAFVSIYACGRAEELG